MILSANIIFVNCSSVPGMFGFVSMQVPGGWGLVSTVVEPCFVEDFFSFSFQYGFTVTVRETFSYAFSSKDTLKSMLRSCQSGELLP